MSSRSDLHSGTGQQPPTLPAIIDIPLVDRPASATRNRPALDDLPDRRIVMVVEDDPATRELILKILGMENYELLSADCGDAALEQVEQHGRIPDLLITDLMMPGMNGTELAAAMRRSSPALAVLYETGFADSLFRAQPELEPGAAFLEKPFSARGLLEAARLALYGTMNPAKPTGSNV